MVINGSEILSERYSKKQIPKSKFQEVIKWNHSSVWCNRQLNLSLPTTIAHSSRKLYLVCSLLQNLNTYLMFKKNIKIIIYNTVCKVEKWERHYSELEHSKESPFVSAQGNLPRNDPYIKVMQVLKIWVLDSHYYSLNFERNK